MKRIMKEQFIIFIAAAVITIVATAVNAFAYDTEAYMNRAGELHNMGLTEEQMMDQLAEEFHNSNRGAGFGTGGIDGKYLDGTIAPNGILAGSGGGSSSSGGSSTPSTPSHTHSYDEGVVTKDATCTAKGEMTYTCSCGKTKTEDLPILDHDWQQSAEHEGNCIEIGKIDLVCMNCGATSTIETSYGGHAYEPSPDSTLPNCTEDGTQIKICSVCDDVWTYTLPAKGHSWESEYTTDLEPTCTTEGSSSIHCSECDATKDVIALSAKGHIETESTIIAPTFWNNGLNVVTCEICHEHFRDITVIAKGGNLRYVIIGASALIACVGLATVIVLIKHKRKKGR